MLRNIVVFFTVLCNIILVGFGEYYDTDPFYSDVKVTGGDSYPELNEITTKVIEDAMQQAQDEVLEQFIEQRYMPVMSANDTGYLRFISKKIDRQVTHQYHASAIMLRGLQILQENYISGYNISAQTFMKIIYKKRFRVHGACEQTSFAKDCAKFKSGGLEYRNIDGYCNNLQHPTWGQAFSTYTRFEFPNYADGINEPPVSSDGSELPNARTLSALLFPAHIVPDKDFNILASEMGQVLAHDSTMQIMDSTDSGPIWCCDTSFDVLPKEQQCRSCMPIKISSSDPFYSRYGQRCMNFVRSITAPRTDCYLGPAEQVNKVSSYLDCTFLYGNTEDVSNSLRTFKNGLLINTYDNGEEIPPFTSEAKMFIKTGDERANQNAHLTAFQVIFLREHNRIAKILKDLNEEWNDERIFQETRRIVIAVYQHITFWEYLPLLLGREFIKNLFSDADIDGYTYNYNEKINAAYINSMTIAFRNLHSTIPSTVRTYSNNCTMLSKQALSDQILKPEIALNQCDGVLNSLICRPMKCISDQVTSEITTKLFKGKQPFGLDLLAFDIQRGRDNGLPAYNTYRELCGLKKVHSFEELIPDMGEERVERLYEAYNDVDDIDLFVGVMYEKPKNGYKIGPVSLCIFREQFYRLMIGDRFFYTNINQSYPFTPEQLKSITSVTMAHLVCKNGQNIKYIQKSAFELPSDRNPRIKCSDMSTIDLSPWKENI